MIYVALQDERAITLSGGRIAYLLPCILKVTWHAIFIIMEKQFINDLTD